MRILLSNDDGIHAPGLRHLREALRGFGDLHVVAPNAEQSAVGHAITLFDPLKVKEVTKDGEFIGHAVVGTPADCVKLAVGDLLPGPPDLVVSGINLGPNTGISCLYSGTVSAASEGTILGFPSVAFSLCTFTDPHWDTAIRVARGVTRRLLDLGLPPDTVLSVNIPNRPWSEIRGLRPARMGRSRFIERFEKREDPRGNAYYWMDGDLEYLDTDRDSDVALVEEGWVTLTPIGLDLTRHSALDHAADLARIGDST